MNQLNSSPRILTMERQHKLMLYFNYYRVSLAVLLIILLQFNFLANVANISGNYQSLIFATGLYLVLCGLGMMFSYREKQNQAAVLAIMLTDITLLGIINLLAGGVDSGLSNLILVSVAAGTLFLSLRNSLLLAAVASSFVVYSEILYGLDLEKNTFMRAALLGIAFFAVTLLIQYILHRTRISEQIAEEHAENILDLQSINQLVIHRMRTGIIVCSPEGEIRMINHSAHLLVFDQSEGKVHELPKEILSLMKTWQQGHYSSRSGPVQIDSHLPEVQINFAALQDHKGSDLMIFIEDASQVKQQAQQMKLASLGRLTASIAHEIRNPLGAISHAGQLLAESESLDSTDLRMLEIISHHSQRMNAIIENVLKLSRQSRSVTELLDLPVWLNQFRQHFKETDPQAILTIVCPEVLPIRFDQSHLQQALTNLVSNGLRYSEKKTGRKQIKIEAGILNANEQPYLDVIDYGPGLDKEQQEHLFEPFYTTDASGTGLGLFITKEMCEANQARLEWLSSENLEEDTGCCFRILFVHPDRQQLD